MHPHDQQFFVGVVLQYLLLAAVTAARPEPSEHFFLQQLVLFFSYFLYGICNKRGIIVIKRAILHHDQARSRREGTNLHPAAFDNESVQRLRKMLEQLVF